MVKDDEWKNYKGDKVIEPKACKTKSLVKNGGKILNTLNVWDQLYPCSKVSILIVQIAPYLWHMGYNDWKSEDDCIWIWDEGSYYRSNFFTYNSKSSCG